MYSRFFLKSAFLHGPLFSHILLRLIFLFLFKILLCMCVYLFAHLCNICSLVALAGRERVLDPSGNRNTKGQTVTCACVTLHPGAMEE